MVSDGGGGGGGECTHMGEYLDEIYYFFCSLIFQL